MKPSWSKGLIIVIAAAILVGAAVFASRILLAEPFNKQEAQHALYGAWIARDIQTLDWKGFWYDTSRQMLWPFLHSWLQGLFFLVFGLSFTSARLLSFVLFLSAALLTYFISVHLSEKDGEKIGVLSALLVLTSPLMIKFGSENLLDIMSPVFFLAAARLYFYCEERKASVNYIFLALLLGLSIYANYMLAYLLLPAFLVMTVVKLGPLMVDAFHLSRRGEKAAMPFIWWAYRKMIVLVVLLALVAVWFSFNFSRKVQLLLGVIFSGSSEWLAQGFWQSLIYYPKIIVEQFSFSPWLGVFLVISLFMPFVAARYRGLNKLFIFTWTSILLATFTIGVKLPNVICLVIPFVLIIFSAALFYFLDALQKKDRRLVRVLLLVIFLPAALSLPGAYGLFFPPRPAENLVDVLGYFKATVPRGESIAASINMEHLNPDVMTFYFWDWPAPVLADTQLAADELFNNSKYLLTIDPDRESRYQTEVLDDSLYRWNDWLRMKEAGGAVILYSSKRFSSIGLTAKVYQRTLL